MKVLEVDGLGYTSAVVTLETGAQLLLLDAGLSQDDRVDIMLGAMSRLDSAGGEL